MERPLAFKAQQYWQPQHWPIWLALGVLWLITRLPLDWAMALGRAVGGLFRLLVPKRRRATQTNIKLAFPELTPAEQSLRVKAVYRHVGMTLIETAWLWFRGMTEFDKRFSVSGVEHLNHALASDSGVILLQAHFSTLEIAGGYVGPRWPIAAVYDRPKNPFVAEWLVAQRLRRIDPMIDNKNIRDMIRQLKRGHTVWYSPDQCVSVSQGGIPSRYFSQSVLTSNGTARIARMTGATIVPMIPTRSDDGRAYHIEYCAPLTLDVSDEQACTQAINDLFESQVKRYPEQYLWLHKRFKPSPGEANPYSL